MTIVDSAVEIASFLDEQQILYAVIGGLAVQYWGEARMTADVDVIVLVPQDRLDSFLIDASSRFRPRLSDALSFAKTNRVLLLSDQDGTPVDIALGLPGYEEEVIRRAASVTVDHHCIRLITPEDLIVLKCVAGRPKDQEDVEGILVRQNLELDFAHIREWLESFNELMEDRDVVAIFESALKRAKSELDQESS